MFSFTLFKKIHSAETLAEISKLFSDQRDKSGRGSSSMPLPEILKDGVVFGHFSYNGKIWEHPSKEWKSGDIPLFDPYAV